MQNEHEQGDGTASPEKVAVLGLGAMGTRIAARLAQEGHAVTGWSRSGSGAATSGGIVHADSVRDAVTGADVVISMVTDDEASRRVWLDPTDGALAALDADAIAVEASTISRVHAIELGAAAEAAGVRFIEAPVVGSRPQAESGALLVLAGGDADVVASAEPVLDAYAAAVRHTGPVGTAATMKLAINGLFGVQVAAYAEIVGLLRTSDVDDGAAIDVLADLPITSPGLQRALKLMAARSFAPNFPISLVAKDFGYLDALARELGAATPVATTTGTVFTELAETDSSELDITGIALRYLED